MDKHFPNVLPSDRPGHKTVRKIPSGIVINTFSITYACDCSVVPHVSPGIRLTELREPGSREKNANIRTV